MAGHAEDVEGEVNDSKVEHDSWENHGDEAHFFAISWGTCILLIVNWSHHMVLQVRFHWCLVSIVGTDVMVLPTYTINSTAKMSQTIVKLIWKKSS